MRCRLLPQAAVLQVPVAEPVRRIIADLGLSPATGRSLLLEGLHGAAELSHGGPHSAVRSLVLIRLPVHLGYVAGRSADVVVDQGTFQVQTDRWADALDSAALWIDLLVDL